MKEENKQNKENTQNPLLFVLAIGLIVVSVLYALGAGNTGADNVLVSSEAKRETITVSETVEKETMPDEALVYIEIETDADTAQEAKDKNADTSDSVLDALKAMGIDEEQIETSSYYLNEKTKWDSDKDEYISIGYTLTHILKVTTSEIDALGEIIDTAVNAGATGINNVEFTLSNDKEKELKQQALEEAAVKAKVKAAALVSAVDTDLGELVSISESSYYNWPRQYYYAKSMEYEESVELATYDTQIAPEQLTVSATVTLTYAIEQ